LRSVAQLKMLHSLALRLNRLNDLKQIGDAITAELKTLIDYHSCRVYLLAEDGVMLNPIVFRGDLTEYQSDTYEELITEVGEGFTGHAAATGETYYAPDALRDEIGVQIEGTDEVEESILCVPLKYGDNVTGVIVLSNLGLDQFDGEDQRLVEVLASHAAVAFENARLFQKEREAAETASALLGLSQSLTGAHDFGTVLERVVAAVPFIVPCSVVATYLHDPATGSFRLLHERGGDPERVRAARETDITSETAARFLLSVNEPFILPKELAKDVPPQYNLLETVREALIAPLRWDPDGFGAVAILAPDDETSFEDRDIALARGIADMASLAIGSARRVHELERFHELVESLEAIFWEADPTSFAFTFLSRRAAMVFGRADGDARPAGRDRRGRRQLDRVPRARTRGRDDLAARPHPCGARRARHANTPRAHRRRHRAQARGAGSPPQRAEVLGGLPARARGHGPTARVGRHEEHLPRGRVA